MKYHTDKTGNKTLLKDLGTSHLINIIKLIERKAEEGIIERHGGGTTAEDMWYDEDHLSGKDALESMNHDDYVTELKSRESK